MCGISFLLSENTGLVKQAVIERMAGALRHRGPDACGTYCQDNVALGHTRLSIVDLKAGDQPMRSDDGRYTLVYNGEIYNYRELRQELKKENVRFHSHCDTEVVLQLYIKHGKDCLSYLRGMFAFAVYDNVAQTVFIARDRMGIKPLYYHFDAGKKLLLGASEIKSIFASGLLEPVLNKASIAAHFKYQFSISPYTAFESILELPPGHYMEVEVNSLSVKHVQYWDLQFPMAGDHDTEDETTWAQRFEDALYDAVDSHTIGDVPIGTYLSGGVDSATTTLLLAQNFPEKVHSFTICFSDQDHDESHIAHEIARFLEIPNHDLLMQDNREPGFIAELVDAIYHLEQVQRLAVDIPHFMLSKLVREFDHKVVYTGDGSDEIFGGYDCFRQDAIRCGGNETQNMEQRWLQYQEQYGQHFAESHLRLLWNLHEPKLQQQVIGRYGCYPAWYDFWHILDDVAHKLLTPQLQSMYENDEQMAQLIYRMTPQVQGRHPLNQSLYIETKTRLPGWILWKSDRLSMAHSVEARVPFMDHHLVELAAAMPPYLKLNGWDEKYILRQLVIPQLPQHPQYFKKRAFYTPIRTWFFTEQRLEQIQEYMSEEVTRNCGCFDSESVQSMMQQIAEVPAPQNMEQYFQLMQLEWGLMIVLSTHILHKLYVEKQATCFH